MAEQWRGSHPETGEIDPAAYGRVTDPERFRPLHDAALALIDELSTTYDLTVTRRRDEEGTAVGVGGPVRERVVHLQPTDPTAAPLTFTLSAFPGVGLAYGRWSDASFPSCGCDACDEDPTEAVAGLTATVRAVVAGSLRESLARRGLHPWQYVVLTGDGWREESGQAISRQRFRELGGRGTHSYAPWPRRDRSAAAG